MATSEDYLIAANRAQTVSEVDGFTGERYQQFARRLPSDVQKILDVGCGKGRGGAVLKECFPQVELTGLDCVPERVAEIPLEIYTQRTCAFSDALPFPDRCFDAIVAGEFLEHVPPEKIDPTICELFRVLTLKGKLLLTTPNPKYLKNRIRGLSVMSDPSHVTQHFASSLRARFKAVGFSSIRIKGTGRVSSYLGDSFPLFLYGSFMAEGVKW